MTAAPSTPVVLEAEGGAVPLDSRFYVTRPTDHEFTNAVARGDGDVSLQLRLAQSD